MDHEIQTTKHSSEIPNTSKHETRISSSSSSSESSVDTIDKEQLVIETKQVHNRNSSMGGSSTTNPSNGQMILQGGAYDPNRIPASVFNNSKPGTPMEWSVASNESLFSIHMGNNSFSRDHIYMLYRSGEIPFDQPMNSYLDSNKPPIPLGNTERKSEVNSDNSKIMSGEEKIGGEQELAGSNTKAISLDPEKIVFPDKNRTDEFRNSCSSTQSFNFPLLEVGGNAIEGPENMHSPKTRGLNEQVEQRGQPQAQAKPEPEPKTVAQARTRSSSIPPKPTTWLSFFSCCSAAN